MQSAWTTAVDEASGATYYYNEQTGESQWESPEQNHGAEIVWRVAGLRGVDAGHTLRSGDERVLSRWNMLTQKLTVSRKQGVVQCLADGTATLTSEGKGPTLWRELGGPWCALQRGGAVYLSEGDQVSLDASDPEAALFTCYLCACQSNLCTCPASPRYQQGDAWACSKAVHPATTMGGASTTNEDDEQQGCSAQQGGYEQQRGSSGSYQQGGLSYQQDAHGYQQGDSAQQGQPYELPYPWVQLADQNGAVYYSNPQTGEASWDPP